METADSRQVELALEALQRALEEERFRHLAGMEREPSLVQHFSEHSLAAHKDTLAALRARSEGDLAFRVAELRAERFSAEDEEIWRAAECSATVQGPDGAVSLAGAERAMARERDRDRRLALELAIDTALAACSTAREAAAEKRARARAESGLVPDWEAVVQGDALLVASDDAYRDVLSWLARRCLGLSPRPQGDLARADLVHLFTLPEYDGRFPAGMLAVVLRQVCQGLGLDLETIRIEDGDRPTQWPGAHASGPRVSLRRLGGVTDWLELFRATGEALVSARGPAHLRQPVQVAAVGSLLQGLLLTPAFLAREVGIDRKQIPDLVRSLALRRLFQLRARAAALRVATEVERGLSGEAWRKAHREALSSAVLATWRRGGAARDGEAGLLVAALMGAARAEATRADLIERYDEDYWRNPRTAEAIAGWTVGGPAVWQGAQPPLRGAADCLVERMENGG
jgi:hypothetical protein